MELASAAIVGMPHLSPSVTIEAFSELISLDEIQWSSYLQALLQPCN